MLFLHQNGSKSILHCQKKVYDIYNSYRGSLNEGKENEENLLTQAEKEVIDQYREKFGCETVIEEESKLATIDAINQCNRILRSNSSPNDSDLKLDVVSVGYERKSQYMKMQLKSWASNVNIRSFWGLTENDEQEKNMKCEQIDISEHIDTCKLQYEQNPVYLEKFKTNIYDKRYFARKKEPVSWICAQSRLVLGLGKKFKEYKKRVNLFGATEALPDYLMIVDDDTYINIDLFSDFVNSKNSSIPVAYSGCRENLITNMGGFNLFLSRASIQRLITPLTCAPRKTNARGLSSISEWEATICKQLEENVLGEYELFYPGMSLSDIAFEFASKKQFCLFSGWFMKYLITQYHLSIIAEDGKRIHPYFETKNCASNGDMYCKIDSHICNWQTPESMASITAVVIKSSVN